MAHFTLKNTKQELLEAYQATLTELTHTKKQLVQAQKELKTTVTTVTTANPTEDLRTHAQPKTFYSVEEIINNLSGLKTQFSESAHVLQQKLSQEALTLQQLHKQVQVYTEDLKNLHQIEANDAVFGELIEAYETTAELQQLEASAKQHELTTQTETAQQEWARIQKEYHLAQQEADKALKKQRQRESDEYEYKFQQLRQQEQSEFEQQEKIYADELALLTEAINTQWQETEEALKHEEKAAIELLEKADNADKELEKAVRRAEEEGLAIGKHQAKTAIDLQKKEFEGKQRVFSSKITALETAITKQVTQIQVLSKQLGTALQQAQDLAVKALEGNADAKSYAAMKEIALEQAKNAQKGK